jgi:peptidoglycan/LPS O-acetylase OafA/YrhL
VRAIAILQIVGFHTGERRFGHAFYAVDLFFILSGFLITVILLQEHESTGRISLRHFWQRRNVRLLPALLSVCGLIAAVAVVNAIVSVRPVLNPTSTQTAFVGIGLAVSYGAAWAQALSDVSLGALSHTWALAIEAWFYAIWPPLLILLLRRRRWLTRVVVAVAATSLVYRLVSEQAFSARYLYFALDERACALLAGCALGAVMAAYGMQIVRHARALTWLGLVAALGLVLLLGRPMRPGAIQAIPWERWGIPLVTVVGVVLVASLAAVPGSLLSRALALRPLIWIGQRSYGIYLYHYAIILLVSPWSPNGRIPLRNGLIAITLSFVLAAASYRWLEQPLVARARERQRRLREQRRAVTPEDGGTPPARQRVGGRVAPA